MKLGESYLHVFNSDLKERVMIIVLLNIVQGFDFDNGKLCFKPPLANLYLFSKFLLGLVD